MSVPFQPANRAATGGLAVAVCSPQRLRAEALGHALGMAGGHEVVAVVDRLELLADVVRAGSVDACVVTADVWVGDDARRLTQVLERSPARIVVVGSRPTTSPAVGRADAVVPSDAGMPDLLDALEQACRAERPDLRLPLEQPAPWGPASLASFLTPRERAVLEGLVRGESTARLARRLGVRPGTARTHVQAVLTKLCVHSRLEAVLFAVEHGLVAVADDGTASTA